MSEEKRIWAFEYGSFDDLLEGIVKPVGYYRNPPDEEPGPCKKCKGEREWVYWRSPKITWQHLCGREGWCLICRKCRKCYDFQLTILSRARRAGGINHS
jgi:hypothetical protein